MKTIQIPISVGIAMLASLSVQAKDTFTKDWNKTYKVNADAAFGLTHKYGDVTITTWEQNTIQVDFHVELEAGNENKAQKILDAITVKEKSVSAGEVILETIFDGGHKDMEEIELSYTIKMPKSIALTLTNHFGDAFVPTLSANAKLDVQYGGLRAEKLNGSSNEVKLAFGNGEIDAIMGGTLHVSYSELDLDELGDVEVTSSFSALDMDDAGKVKIHSSYDGYEIDRIKSLDVHANFSSFEIDHLENALDAIIEYGGIEVDNISKAFSMVKIQAEFSSVELEFDDGASYSLDVSSSFGNVEYPSGLKKSSHNKDGMRQSLKGTMGASPGNKTVTISSKQGNVEID